MDYALIFLVTETLLTITKENLVLSLGASSRFLNPFVPNAPVLYPPEKIRKSDVSRCWRKGACIGKKWVKRHFKTLSFVERILVGRMFSDVFRG